MPRWNASPSAGQCRSAERTPTYAALQEGEVEFREAMVTPPMYKVLQSMFLHPRLVANVIKGPTANGSVLPRKAIRRSPMTGHGNAQIEHNAPKRVVVVFAI